MTIKYTSEYLNNDLPFVFHSIHVLLFINLKYQQQKHTRTAKSLINNNQQSIATTSSGDIKRRVSEKGHTF